ncbi:DUF2934 domain-containing protein [Methylobacterium oxalidis]|uniref:DUF2934 domain-containing protein n=1 Tax=Methylobacterium oxalidis TaxID=944322 RepID=A0A512J1I6_9HYPH|nr:DUF2934 domain-containing protein [Methylobacterium oxalidis]GEP03832.1 hypothetical protein MOX02_18700 [Methylobacterium oxalidis]GJE31294.1 hypothetical protein LDDCCGHA_1471 [Methylobacterium oxalidis]GLS65310.1 hypothetical protein GCM10007888_36920 [Methylobacterium oxalidis]
MEPAPEITFEQIRERAYDLWERNHRLDGFEIEFWLMAERELKAERSRSHSGTRADDSGTGPTTPEPQRPVRSPAEIEGVEVLL